MSKVTNNSECNTYLSASGLFDWSKSSIVQDVYAKNESFSTQDGKFYSESELVELIAKFKESN